MASKNVAFSFNNIDFLTTNHAAAVDKNGVDADFHLMMDFMANGALGYALTAQPEIYAQAVAEAWTSAKHIDGGNLTMTINKVTYLINAGVIRKSLNLPSHNNFANLPSEDNIRDMLRTINYSGSLSVLSKLSRPNLRKEWSLLFDQISKCFTGKCSAFDQITKVTAQICYALVYNVNIDYASLILNQIASKISSAPGSTSKVYFHRFIQLMINHLMGIEAAAKVFENTQKFNSFAQQKRIFSDLIRSDKNKGTIPPLVYPLSMQVTLPSLIFSYLYFFVFW